MPPQNLRAVLIACAILIMSACTRLPLSETQIVDMLLHQPRINVDDTFPQFVLTLSKAEVLQIGDAGENGKRLPVRVRVSGKLYTPGREGSSTRLVDNAEFRMILVKDEFGHWTAACLRD